MELVITTCNEYGTGAENVERSIASTRGYNVAAGDSSIELISAGSHPVTIQISQSQDVNGTTVYYDKLNRTRITSGIESGELHGMHSNVPLEIVIPGAVFQLPEGNFFRSRIMQPEGLLESKVVGIRWAIGITPGIYSDSPVFQDKYHLLRLVIKRGLYWQPGNTQGLGLSDELSLNYLLTDDEYRNPNRPFEEHIQKNPDMILEHSLRFNPATRIVALKSCMLNNPQIDNMIMVEDESVESFERLLGLKVKRDGDIWVVRCLDKSFTISDKVPEAWRERIAKGLPPFLVNDIY